MLAPQWIRTNPAVVDDAITKNKLSNTEYNNKDNKNVGAPLKVDESFNNRMASTVQDKPSSSGMVKEPKLYSKEIDI